MTVLLFASYKFRNSVMSFNQGSISTTLIMESPSEFPKYMKELEDIIKKQHGSDVVVIENITMQEWKDSAA